MHLCALLAVLSLAASPQPDDDLKKVVIVRDAFLANLALVPHGEFDFLRFQGSAPSLEAAENGKFTTMYRATGTYIFDRDNALLRETFAKDDIINTSRQVGEDQTSVYLTNKQLLTDRKLLCLDFGDVNDIKARTLRSFIKICKDEDQERFHSEANFLMPYGQEKPDFSLLNDIQAALDRSATLVECDLNAVRDGGWVGKLTIESKDKSRRRYVIDLDRGAIPVEEAAYDPDGKLMTIGKYTGLFLMQDRGWVPHSHLYYRAHDLEVRGMQITEARLAKRPDVTSYSLTFDNKYDVVDESNRLTYVGIDGFSFRNPTARPEQVVPLGQIRKRAVKP